jgi:hypothetical protein
MTAKHGKPVPSPGPLFFCSILMLMAKIMQSVQSEYSTQLPNASSSNLLLVLPIRTPLSHSSTNLQIQCSSVDEKARKSIILVPLLANQLPNELGVPLGVVLFARLFLLLLGVEMEDELAKLAQGARRVLVAQLAQLVQAVLQAHLAGPRLVVAVARLLAELAPVTVTVTGVTVWIIRGRLGRVGDLIQVRG